MTSTGNRCCIGRFSKAKLFPQTTPSAPIIRSSTLPILSTDHMELEQAVSHQKDLPEPQRVRPQKAVSQRARKWIKGWIDQ